MYISKSPCALMEVTNTPNPFVSECTSVMDFIARVYDGQSCSLSFDIARSETGFNAINEMQQLNVAYAMTMRAIAGVVHSHINGSK